MKIATARAPYAGVLTFSPSLGATVGADPAERLLEDVHRRVATADLNPADVAAVELDVPQQTVVGVSVVLRPVAD